MIVVDGVARRISDGLGHTPDPGQFDLLASSYDNAGNVVHTEAPFAFWDTGSGDVIDARELRARSGLSFTDTVDFANRNASHFIFSATNFIMFEGTSRARRSSYIRLAEELDRLTIPLVILGMGTQAPRRWNPQAHELPTEAVEFMRFLGAKCDVISLRGDFSAQVFRDYAGVTNTVVTGCPSFFQRPQAFVELREFLAGRRRGVPSFSATNVSKPAERILMHRAITERMYWVEVTDRQLQALSREGSVEPELAAIPSSLRGFVGQRPEDTRRADLVDYFAHRLRFFDNLGEWRRFVADRVRFSFGTRFHANMATLLSGRPALWITHDMRTAELVSTLRLPSATLTEAVQSSTEELEASTDYGPTLEAAGGLFHRWNEFLDEVGLPRVSSQF